MSGTFESERKGHKRKLADALQPNVAVGTSSAQPEQSVNISIPSQVNFVALHSLGSFCLGLEEAFLFLTH